MAGRESVATDHVYQRLELNHIDSRSCRRPRILAVLSALLDRVVVRNERYAMATAAATAAAPPPSPSCPNLTVFHGLKAPSISIDKYLERIFKYANCSPACFVVAYVYIDRFIQQKPSMPITSLNVHRLLVTSVMVAAKFLDDAYYNNAYYAKVGGVNTQEMNRLELEFLFHINFRLQVTVTLFESYCHRLETELKASHIERPLHIQTGCGLDGGVTSGPQTNTPDKQRLPTVRCSVAGL